MKTLPLHPPRDKPSYLVNHQGETLGPFDANFIEAMVIAQVYPRSVLVQKAGTQEWVSFHTLGSATKSSAGTIAATGSISKLPSSSSSSSSPSKSRRPKSKVETTAVWMGAVGGVLALVTIVNLSIGSKPPIKPSNGPVKHENPVPRSLDRSSASLPATKASYLSSPSPKLPANRETPRLYRDASGRTYRVPDSAYYRLLSLQSELSRTKANIDTEERRLKSMSREIETDRLLLDRRKQREVTAFNQKVGVLNRLNAEVQSMTDGFNRDVEAFNSELERVGTPIN